MKNKLTQQLLTRSKTTSFQFLNMLPDPDVVLKKTGLHIETYRDLCSDSHLFSCMQQRISGVAARDEILQKQGINFTKEYYMKHFNLKEEDFNLKF